MTVDAVLLNGDEKDEGKTLSGRDKNRDCQGRWDGKALTTAGIIIDSEQTAKNRDCQGWWDGKALITAGIIIDSEQTAKAKPYEPHKASCC